MIPNRRPHAAENWRIKEGIIANLKIDNEFQRLLLKADPPDGVLEEEGFFKKEF